jgi:hypothetical protein
MWIYFIKDYFKKKDSGEVVGEREGANINCPDDEKALDLIERGYCIESQEVPVK